MARDFKTRRARKRGFSGWTGLAIGLLLGLAVAAGVYLHDHRPEPGAAPPARAARKHRGGDTPEADTSEANAAQPQTNSYGFYKMLPQSKVEVPEKDRSAKPEIRTVPETRRGTYVLQAGTHHSFAEADRSRAQLALQGIESRVQKVTVDSDTFYRVKVGPVSNLDELNALRQKLHKSGIDAEEIRVGD